MSYLYGYSEHLVDDPSNIPTTTHHLIIVWEEVAVDDGWGGHNRISYARTYVFTDIAKWEQAVKELTLDEGEGYPKRKQKFKAYKNAHPANITLRADVSIG